VFIGASCIILAPFLIEIENKKEIIIKNLIFIDFEILDVKEIPYNYVMMSDELC